MKVLDDPQEAAAEEPSRAEASRCEHQDWAIVDELRGQVFTPASIFPRFATASLTPRPAKQQLLASGLIRRLVGLVW